LDIRNRLTDVLSSNEINENDYVILFWDSDCSNVDEATLSPEEVIQVRASFNENLEAVVTQILSSTKYLAVAGPELLGEGVVCPSRIHKNDMLDDYRVFTQTITEAHQLNYIDMRQAFLDAVPSNWLFCSGVVTVDGEHPNERGTIIEANLFAKQINAWYEDQLKMQ